MWKVVCSDAVEAPFRDKEAFAALQQAGSTLVAYDEKCYKYVVGYENGTEIVLEEDNCLQKVMAYEAKEVLAFVETTPIGKGLYPPYVTCSNARCGRFQVCRPFR